jgi:hypothetical protein
MVSSTIPAGDRPGPHKTFAPSSLRAAGRPGPLAYSAAPVLIAKADLEKAISAAKRPEPAPCPYRKPKRLTVACESGDSQRDGRSLQIDLVRYGRGIPVARCAAR